MGLLDSLTSQGGYGGLLDALLYRSPLQEQAPQAQPQYDPMGNYTGVTIDPPNPFGPIPQANLPTPSQFQPPSVFNSGANPVVGIPAAQAPAPPAPQAAVPSPQPQDPTRTINVGNYQMPQIGSPDLYQPQQAALPQNATPTQGMQQPIQPPQNTQLPPALGGVGSTLGRLFNPDGLVARLTGNDSRSIAQQNLKAQYEALAPIVGPQKAMLAVLNPEASKTILAQALEKKNFGFQKLDDGTIVRTDPQTGKVDQAFSQNDNPGTVTGPDGKQIAIPPGVDRATFVKEVSRQNAKAASGEKTEVQAKAEIFANKMELSNKAITDGVGTSLSGKIASGLPLGNYIQTPEYQKYKQAASNFITALLRQESGAAISKAEFDRYDQEYMPQPGDSPQVLAQKSEARRIAIEGMKKGAGPGYKSPTSPGNTTQSGVSWSIVQ